MRRLSRNVLALGSIVAVLAAFGPLWLVRIGVGVAVAAAVVACSVAWQELAAARREHATHMLEASRAHGAALSEERRQNASVVETVTRRMVRAIAQVESQRGTILALRNSIETLSADISTLSGELSTLGTKHTEARQEIRQSEEAIAFLTAALRSREAELEAVSEGAGPEGAGQVRALPRRVLSEPDAELGADGAVKTQVSEIESLLPEGRQPGIAELVQTTVVLPNYEGDRKLA